MKKVTLFILILFISHCGYTPIYNSDNKTKIKINILKTEGDQKINNLLISDIERISRSDYEKEFDIIINSKFIKIITSKDSKGVASNFQLKVITKFEIVKQDGNEFYLFEEKIDIQNNNNLFEQKKYENNIKITFVRSIINKLIEKLMVSK